MTHRSTATRPPIPTPDRRPPLDQRYFLSVPPALCRALAGLPVPVRDQVMERALALVQGRVRVLVCDAHRVLLHPCHPARARELIRRGRARLVSVQPPLIQLHHAVARAPEPPRS